MSVLLPSSPALQETPLSPFGKSSTPLSCQRCRLSNKKVARWMKLKVQMRKLLKKNGRMLVRDMMEEVAREEWVMRDVFGCADCFVDPHNGHVSYCPLSRRLSVRSQPIPSFPFLFLLTTTTSSHHPHLYYFCDPLRVLQPSHDVSIFVPLSRSLL